MKKVLLVSAIAMLALASCKKDYTCECTLLGQTTETVLTDVSKKDATTACDESSTAVSILGGSCELK